MLVQYSRRAQQALALARAEAGRRGTEVVGPEHLLLALLADTHCVAWRVMNRLGAGTDAIRADLRATLPPFDGDDTAEWSFTDADAPLDLIPMTEDVERAVAIARSESRLAEEFSVGTAHLLIGLLAEEDSMVAQSLTRHGILAERVRHEMAREQEP